MRKGTIFLATLFLLISLISTSFGEIRQLTNFNSIPFNMSYTTLSGDGKHIYFISTLDLVPGNNANKYSQIFMLDVNSKTIKQISNFTTERYLSYLKVSGNDLRLVFGGGMEGQPSSSSGNVFVMDTTGNNLRLVSLEFDTSVAPSITWDGEWIIYGVSGGYIDLVKYDGTGRSLVTSGVNALANLSGNGTLVGYVDCSGGFGCRQLYVIKPDGSGLKQLTNDDNIRWFGGYIPQLSYTGDYSLYLSYGILDGIYKQNIFRIKTDGTETINVSNVPESLCDSTNYCLPLDSYMSYNGNIVVYNIQYKPCIGNEGHCSNIIKKNLIDNTSEVLVDLALDADYSALNISDDASVVIFQSNVNINNENPNKNWELFACIGNCNYQPKLEVSPSLYSFGDQAVQVCSTPPSIFSLKNTGNADLNITDISIANIDDYILDLSPLINPCATLGKFIPNIAQGGFCNIGIQFCPQMSGPLNNILIVMSNDSNSPANIQMTGNGISTDQNLGTPPLYNENNLIMTTNNNSNFADQEYFKYYNSNHNGTDLALSADGSATASKITLLKSVHAICDGQVIDSNFSNNNPDMTYMQVRHTNCGGQDLMAYYGHIKTSLTNGTPIKKGDILGSVVKYTKNWNHLHLTLDTKTERNLFSINYQMCDYIYDINSRAVTGLSNCVYSSSRAKLPKDKMMLKVGYGRVTTDRYTNSNGKQSQKSLYISEFAMKQLGFISYFDLQ